MIPLLLAVLSQPIVLTNGTILDADGAREGLEIRVVGDRIASIGRELAVDGDRVVDLEGGTVVPGLIDCHVHLAMHPGSLHRTDAPPTTDRLNRHHLRAYLASGVTTVLDTGITFEAAQELRELLDEGVPAPEVHLLGPLVSPEGGYVHVVLPEFPGFETGEQLRAEVARFDAVSPIGIKLTFEPGMVRRGTWPLYNDSVLEGIAEERAAGRKLFVHATRDVDVRAALELQPYAIVHAPHKPREKTIARLAEAGTFVVSTISIFDHILFELEPERREDALVKLTVPSEELETATDPGVQVAWKRRVARTVLPHSPGFMQNIAASLFGKRGPLDRRIAHLQDAVVQLQEAGVPIVLGSDSGNWPVFTTEFHGPTTVRELELLIEGGLGVEEALAAATSNAAEMLELSDVGKIQPGYRADLLVLGADPRTDAAAFRAGRFVMRAGELRTPQEWMVP